MEELIEDEDYYWEGGFMVFTAKFHLRRGSCCGSGCRHCPYEPPGVKGITEIAAEKGKFQIPGNSSTSSFFYLKGSKDQSDKENKPDMSFDPLSL
ncbi:MAG: DUF5522 domain-containing protein [Acidobacteriota bacterium]